MEVIEVKHVEDCFDDSSIYELLLDADISKEWIFAVGEGGHVQYFDNFAKPFFKIRVDGMYDLKGIQGTRTIRVHLKSRQDFTLDDFLAKITSLTCVPV